MPCCRNRADVSVILLTALVNRAHKLCRSAMESTFFLDFLLPSPCLPLPDHPRPRQLPSHFNRPAPSVQAPKTTLEPHELTRKQAIPPKSPKAAGCGQRRNQSRRRQRLSPQVPDQPSPYPPRPERKSAQRIAKLSQAPGGGPGEAGGLRAKNRMPCPTENLPLCF